MWNDDVNPDDYDRALQARKSWVSESDLSSLMLERQTITQETEIQQAQRILREAAPMAASSLVRLAQYGETETVRLRASIEILNRSEQMTENGKEPWADFFDTTAVEAHANQKP